MQQPTDGFYLKFERVFIRDRCSRYQQSMAWTFSKSYLKFENPRPSRCALRNYFFFLISKILILVENMSKVPWPRLKVSLNWTNDQKGWSHGDGNKCPIPNKVIQLYTNIKRQCPIHEYFFKVSRWLAKNSQSQYVSPHTLEATYNRVHPIVVWERMYVCAKGVHNSTSARVMKRELKLASGAHPTPLSFPSFQLSYEHSCQLRSW